MMANELSDQLAGQNILLVEDEYFLADEIRRALLKAGANVVGPYGDIAGGLAGVKSAENLSSAVLDVKVRGDNVSPVADALRSRGTPFVFATGYDRAAIPAAYRDVPHCEKPINTTELIRLLAEAAKQEA